MNSSSLEGLRSQLLAEMEVAHIDYRDEAPDHALELEHFQALFLAHLEQQVQQLQTRILLEVQSNELLPDVFKKRIGSQMYTSKEEVADRIQVMLQEEHELMADPTYMEEVQDKGMTVQFRKRLSQWMLAVRLVL